MLKTVGNPAVRYGDQTVNDGNFVIGTAGKGVDFSVNGGDVLAIYDEGTFSPTVEGSTDAGTVSYVARTGAYTRIGRVVYFQIYVVWNSGTGTGELRIGGLPFLSGAGSLAYGGAFAPLFLDVALAANNCCSGAYVLSTDTKMRFFQTPTGGGTATPVNYDAAGECMIVGQYFV